MKSLLFGAKSFNLKRRTLTDTSDQHGEAGESYTSVSTIVVKLYPADNTESRNPYGIDPNEMYTGLTDVNVQVKDKLESSTESYLVMGVRDYYGSTQMDLWKDTTFTGGS